MTDKSPGKKGGLKSQGKSTSFPKFRYSCERICLYDNILSIPSTNYAQFSITTTKSQRASYSMLLCCPLIDNGVRDILESPTLKLILDLSVRYHFYPEATNFHT